MRRLIKWHADERVDLPDANDLAGQLSLYENMRMMRSLILPTGRNTGAAATECRIFGGFVLTFGGGLAVGHCLLTRGTGILKLLREGNTLLGLVTGDLDPASFDMDLSGYGNGVYSVYVRLAYSTGTSENRVHWHQATTQEIVSFVTTREELTWEWVATTGSPPAGGDWVKIWEVTVAAGAVTIVADYRHFFFEGDGKSGAGQWAHEWGTALDRNANRATYGIQDFHKLASAFRKKVEDIQGSYYSWWEEPGLSLSDLDNEHWYHAKGGKHRQMTFGDTGYWWKISSYHGMANSQGVNIQSQDLAIDAGLRISIDDDSGDRYMEIAHWPYGATQDLQDGDRITHRLGWVYEDRFTRLSATRQTKTLIAPPAAFEYEWDLGVGFNVYSRGLWIGADSAYHMMPRTVNLLVDCSSAKYDGGAGWILTWTPIFGSPDASVLWSNVANSKLCLVVHGLPHYCKLNSILVSWYQTASHATRETRLYPWRVTHGLGGVAGISPAPFHTSATLNSGIPHVEYVYDAGSKYRKSLFTCNQNNEYWMRDEEELHLLLEAGDTGAIDNIVHAIQLNVTYTEACPFPPE